MNQPSSADSPRVIGPSDSPDPHQLPFQERTLLFNNSAEDALPSNDNGIAQSSSSSPFHNDSSPIQNGSAIPTTSSLGRSQLLNSSVGTASGVFSSKPQSPSAISLSPSSPSSPSQGSRLGAKPPGLQTWSPAPQRFVVGSIVVVEGLEKHSSFNGKQARVSKVDAQRGRYEVYFEGNGSNVIDGSMFHAEHRNLRLKYDETQSAASTGLGSPHGASTVQSPQLATSPQLVTSPELESSPQLQQGEVPNMMPWHWPAWSLDAAGPCIQVYVSDDHGKEHWVDAAPHSLVTQEGQTLLCAEYSWERDQEDAWLQDFAPEDVRRRGDTKTIQDLFNEQNPDCAKAPDTAAHHQQYRRRRESESNVEDGHVLLMCSDVPNGQQAESRPRRSRRNSEDVQQELLVLERAYLEELKRQKESHDDEYELGQANTNKKRQVLQEQAEAFTHMATEAERKINETQKEHDAVHSEHLNKLEAMAQSAQLGTEEASSASQAALKKSKTNFFKRSATKQSVQLSAEAEAKAVHQQQLADLKSSQQNLQKSAAKMTEEHADCVRHLKTQHDLHAKTASEHSELAGSHLTKMRAAQEEALQRQESEMAATLESKVHETRVEELQRHIDQKEIYHQAEIESLKAQKESHHRTEMERLRLQLVKEQDLLIARAKREMAAQEESSLREKELKLMQQAESSVDRRLHAHERLQEEVVALRTERLRTELNEYRELVSESELEQQATLVLRFIGLQLNQIDQQAFKRELLEQLLQDGVPAVVFERLQVRLRDGSVIAEISGNESYVRLIKGKMVAKPIRVMGSLPYIEDAVPYRIGRSPFLQTEDEAIVRPSSREVPMAFTRAPMVARNLERKMNIPTSSFAPAWTFSDEVQKRQYGSSVIPSPGLRSTSPDPYGGGGSPSCGDMARWEEQVNQTQATAHLAQRQPISPRFSTASSNLFDDGIGAALPPNRMPNSCGSQFGYTVASTLRRPPSTSQLVDAFAATPLVPDPLRLAAPDAFKSPPSVRYVGAQLPYASPSSSSTLSPRRAAPYDSPGSNGISHARSPLRQSGSNLDLMTSISTWGPTWAEREWGQQQLPLMWQSSVPDRCNMSPASRQIGQPSRSPASRSRALMETRAAKIQEDMDALQAMRKILTARDAASSALSVTIDDRDRSPMRWSVHSASRFAGVPAAPPYASSLGGPRW